MKTDNTLTHALRKLNEEVDDMSQLEKAQIGIEILRRLVELKEKRGA